MEIRQSDWQEYINRLSAVNQRASERMQTWMDEHPTAPAEQTVGTAYALSTGYGEAAGELACEMYDEIATAQRARVPAAEPAPTATYGETARAVYGTMKTNPESVPGTVGRLVKQVGADTMLQNARRDGAEFAWVPMGDTCAFCLTLASRGWQRQSKKGAERHASHIHNHCDCEYCVRFDGKSGVQGYDPDKYLEMYENAEGRTPQEKINSLRREHYAENAPTIRAQKRAAYALASAKPEKVGNTVLYRKKHPETIERALRNANPGYNSGPEYHENCQRCVPAYEMQRRGYVVKAKPALIGSDGHISTNDATVKTGAWYMPFKGMTWNYNASEADIETAMAQYGDGARAEVYVKWENRLGAHVFIAEQSQGKTLFLDPQSGDKDCSRYFTDAIPGSIMFSRIDGLAPSDDIDLFIESSR